MPLALALVAALLSLSMLASGSVASSGGIGPSTQGSQDDSDAKYDRLWDEVSAADKRWAHRVSECESGHDPNLTAMNGEYRGAFMFTRDAWKTSPKSPGGDPIDYPWKTQAVVAVALKKRDGTGPWPVCG